MAPGVVRPFVRLSVRSFVCPSVRPFVRPFVRSIDRSRARVRTSTATKCVDDSFIIWIVGVVTIFRAAAKKQETWGVRADGEGAIVVMLQCE